MREMKDSGIQWVGVMPNSWKIVKFKYICSIKANLVDVNSYKEYPQISPDNIAKDSGVLLNYNTVEESGVISDNHLFYKGQIIYSKIRPKLNKAVIAPFDGLCSADMYPIETTEYTKFILYAFLSQYFLNQVVLKTEDRVKMPKINQDELGEILVVLPPLYEQQQITDFLDKKCSEIDSLISDIQKQIDTLEDYKRSVITEAVTKGLDRDVEMRDSGIAWVGEIPTHWTLIRIGSLYGLRTQKVSDIDYPPLSVTKMGVLPQLDTVAKTNAHDDRKLVVKGDFVINSRSDRRGSCGISDYTGSVSLINTVLYPITEMNPRYYNWYFHTVGFADEFYRWGHGIVDDLWTTGWQDMKNILISVPPLDEQQQIADYLDSKCAEIDSIIADKKQQIETIEEYKKSLIFEYVTGKKEVQA